MQSSLETRLEWPDFAPLEKRDFNSDDDLYGLFNSFVVRHYLPVLDAAFGVPHTKYVRADGIQSGYEMTAFVISVPRERRKGLLNTLARFFSPMRTVIQINYNSGRIYYDNNYRFYAQKIKQQYDRMLRKDFGVSLRLEPPAPNLPPKRSRLDLFFSW